jgi:hypothetical protein
MELYFSYEKVVTKEGVFIRTGLNDMNILLMTVVSTSRK